MEILYQILLASVGLSLLSLVGIFATHRLEQKTMHVMVSFAAGALLGASFLHLIPEALESIDAHDFFPFVLVGFLVFFVLEKFIYWWHCHDGKCDIHPFSYLSLVGDAVHNFTDGVIIAAAFLSNAALGFTATIAVALHELPQEIGDYFILRHGGFSKAKALGFNFLSAITSVFGALLTYFFLQGEPGWIPYLIALSSGGFIYIASADLVPEIHKIKDNKESLIHFGFLLLGLGAIYFMNGFIGH